MMHDNHAVQRKHGAEIVFQSPSELKTHFPWLNTEDLAGGFLGLSNEGWLDPYGLLQAFRRRARSLGVTYIDDEAIGVARQGSRAGPVTLRDAGQIEAGVVVNAAGARDAAHIAGLVGIELPVEPRKRCVFVFECREAMGRMPLTIFTNGLGVRPEGRSFLCNMAPPPGHDPVTSKVEVDYALFDDVLWPTLAQRIPAFESIKLLNAYTCHYDVNTLDGNVIIGRPPELDNFYLVAGFSGHGLMQSPAIGRAMSELVTFGEYRTLDLTRFGYERVLTGEKIQETNCY
jgi:glycine/D-amino acid oxidase-like deaminating enzyme